MARIISDSSTLRKNRTAVHHIVRNYYLRECLYLLVAFLIVSQFIIGLYHCTNDARHYSSHDYAANSTLGFGAIYAVSRQNSDRQQSLRAAANLTNLHITVPEQPAWTEVDLVRVRAFENSTLGRGSALAWLGHLHVLRRFLKSSYHTVLIMEDDADWDTRLRSQQIPRLANAFRKLMNSTGGHYYGDLRSWDVLWLGHCGDYFNASRGSTLTSIKSFHDPAMPNLDDLHSWTKAFMEEIGAKENQQRLVHSSVNPLCTFAYAVTRSGAERIANDLAIREPVREKSHPCEAYDVRLLEGCRDEGLRCFSVNPELFHHSNIHSEIAQATEDTIVGYRGSQGEASYESSSTNIRCSARSMRWEELRKSLTDLPVNIDVLVRQSAESLPDCYIDDL